MLSKNTQPTPHTSKDLQGPGDTLHNHLKTVQRHLETLDKIELMRFFLKSLYSVNKPGVKQKTVIKLFAKLAATDIAEIVSTSQ